MKLSPNKFWMASFALIAAPVFAQTQIGGGTCNSSSLNGTYAVSMTARQVNSSGTFLGVLQGNGLASFDGLSNVTFSLTQNTNQASGTPLNWSGTYTVQANCAATASITTGGNASLNLVVFNQGKNFLLTGGDATYAYSGNGVVDVAPQGGCSTGAGTYGFDATGFTLSGSSVNGVANGTGVLQLDAQGNAILNYSTTTSATPSGSGTATGTYTIQSNCTGTVTLSDSSGNSFVMDFTAYNVTATNVDFYITFAQSANFLMAGGGRLLSSPSSTNSCSLSSLNGTYPLTVSGRSISPSGAFTGSFQAIGSATFDGNGNVNVTGVANTNLAQGTPLSYTGTYTLASNCSGTLTLKKSTYALIVFGNGTSLNFVGADSQYIYSGSGGNTYPVACATSTISGEYSFSANGFTLSGTSQTGVQDEAGILQFDGQGNVTAKYTDSAGGITPVSLTGTGTYTMGSGCTAAANWNDSAGNANTVNLAVSGLHGETMDLLAANSQFVRIGSAHSAFTNPSQAITNVASYAYSATPPGSVFAIFGQNFATKPAGAVTTNLPTQLLNTTVSVNNQAVPLFYVDTGQIDAQMPWNIPGGTVASVVVTNGTSTSNAAAVYVPATGTPGISVYGNNRAVVVNADGSVNSASAGANVNDEVVVYFTGGGPVQAAGKLTTGDPAPSGLSPVTGTNSVTVGGQNANVVYMGLTPGSIGLYQANFYVPQLAKGTYPVIITIAGQASNNPVMTVSN